MSGSQYPHTLDNGAGERLTFLRRAPGVRGDRLEVTNVVAPGAGPPMHVHHWQEESLTVVAGRMAYRSAGGPVRFAGPGETVVFAPGDAHRFWNAGTTELRCTGWIEPADSIEYFLREIFASQQRNGGTRPGVWDAAFLSWRYRGEFAIREIPPVVQRLLFPAIVAVGRLLGRYARHADAPEPVHRAPPAPAGGARTGRARAVEARAIG